MSLFLSRDEAMRRAEELSRLLGCGFSDPRPNTQEERKANREAIRAWMKRAENK